MHDPNGNRQLRRQGLKSHVVQEDRLALPQHHRWQQQLIAQLFALQPTEQILTRQQSGHHLLLPPIGTRQPDQMKLNAINSIEPFSHGLQRLGHDLTNHPAATPRLRD